MSKTCAMPGCESTLYPGSKTGLCRKHNHQAPYCQCFQCTGKAPLAEQLLPGARRIELFSRTNRTGWTTWGNETGKFGEAA